MLSYIMVSLPEWLLVRMCLISVVTSTVLNLTPRSETGPRPFKRICWLDNVLIKIVYLHFMRFSTSAAHFLQIFSLLMDRITKVAAEGLVLRHLFSVQHPRPTFHQNTNSSLCSALCEWSSHPFVPVLPPVYCVLRAPKYHTDVQNQFLGQDNAKWLERCLSWPLRRHELGPLSVSVFLHFVLIVSLFCNLWLLKLT